MLLSLLSVIVTLDQQWVGACENMYYMLKRANSDFLLMLYSSMSCSLKRCGWLALLVSEETCDSFHLPHLAADA